MSPQVDVGRRAAARRRRRGPDAGRRSARSSTSTARSSTATRSARSPATTCGRARSRRSTRGGCCCWACAGSRHRGGLRDVLRARHARVGGTQRGRARRAGRTPVGAGDRGLALPGGLAAGRGAPSGRAHRGVRLVGHPLPGGARRARDGRRARARHARSRSRTASRPDAPAGRRCGGAARPTPCWRSRRGTASTSQRATRTPTAPRTCRSCRRSGARGRSTPSRGWRSSAAEKGWPVVRFRPRGPGRAAAGRAHRGGRGRDDRRVRRGCRAGRAERLPPRRASTSGISLAGELGTALAGVRLDVRGAEHLESARPAVFLFNHQSQLDVLILAKLLRGGFTGVAKKEAANVPAFGLMFRLADVAFVDRGNTAQAKAALAPAVARLREGISLVMAPEGTRSATPALGPFKKGAFHVAMQAGVPIVPIVIRNAGELMWRGCVDHPGGHGAGHRAAAGADRRLDGRGARPSTSTEVRERYVETLAAWDGPQGPACRCDDRAHRAGRRAAGVGHGGRDEPARDRDVARRAGRSAAALERHPAGAARRHPGLGSARSRRTSGPRGWCRGCASGWSSPRSGSARPRGSPSTGSTSPSTSPAPT